jgi:hypothetical protein
MRVVVGLRMPLRMPPHGNIDNERLGDRFGTRTCLKSASDLIGTHKFGTPVGNETELRHHHLYVACLVTPRISDRIRNRGSPSNGSSDSRANRDTIARISLSPCATPSNHGLPGGPQKHRRTAHSSALDTNPLHAPLRAPASGFPRSASHPMGLQGALEARTAARQHGDRLAARSSRSHAQE